MTTKIVLTVIVGVFVGAFAYELTNRKKPELLQKAKDSLSDFRQAFSEGYRGELPSA